jgi:hypothetical protein
MPSLNFSKIFSKALDECSSRLEFLNCSQNLSKAVNTDTHNVKVAVNIFLYYFFLLYILCNIHGYTRCVPKPCLGPAVLF